MKVAKYYLNKYLDKYFQNQENKKVLKIKEINIKTKEKLLLRLV